MVGIGFAGMTHLSAVMAAMTDQAASISDVPAWMLVLQGIVLGIVQGITEFLPISSTAHLIIFTDILHWKNVWDKPAIDAIQFGSVIAVVWYFRKEIVEILTGAWLAFQRKDWQQEEWKILVGVSIGTVPALAVGFLLKKLGVELEQPLLIAVAAIVGALFLGLAEKFGIRKRDFDQLQVTDGLLVGLGQMAALLPGISRSGATLTTGMFLGLKRETAARFSFLFGIPTLTIATLVQAKDVLSKTDMALPLLTGIVSTFFFSYLSIAWLLRYLQRQTSWVFVWYRIGLGVALLIAVGANLL
jgi:undecaprenyl-diphosphatase